MLLVSTTAVDMETAAVVSASVTATTQDLIVTKVGALHSFLLPLFNYICIQKLFLQVPLPSSSLIAPIFLQL
jgi:hypothetical protein